MSHYLAYCQETSQLVYLSEDAPTGLSENYVVEYHEEVMPRLDLYKWEPARLGFSAKTITKFTPLEFFNRFTMSERIYIKTLSETNPIVDDIYAQFNKAEQLWTNDQSLIDGLNYFIYIGALTSERVVEILTK